MTTGELILAALAAHKLKDEGSGNWRCNSPLRSGSDSHSFVVSIKPDGEHGAYTDHVTGDSGSLYQLAERLGIETPKAQAQETKRAYTSLADYAAAHYAPATAFEAAGWKADTHKERPCLTYTVGGKLRYRYLDGNTPAYEWEKGGKPAWYGLKRAIQTTNSRALILCNGEASTISAQHYGLPACAWAGGEQKLPEAALAELKAAYTGPILLAYDCDETGQRVAQEVAAQLSTAGYDVRIADLQMTTHGDLADFCGLHTTAAYAELDKRTAAFVPDVQATIAAARQLEQAARAAATDPAATLEKQVNQLAGQVERIQALVAPPRVIDFHELADAALTTTANTRRWAQLPIPELAALVGPLEPELYVIYGAPNMGKSWAATTLAAALSRFGTGLMITTETQPQKFFNRMVSYGCRVPLDRKDDGLATVQELADWNKTAAQFKQYDGRILNLSSPTGRQVRAAAQAARKDIGLDWIIVDSATRMRGSGEGVYERSSSVANALQDMARDLNVPVIITSQVGRDVGNRPAGQHQPRMEDAYGSGVIEQNAGVVLGLYRHDYYVTRGTETPNLSEYPPDTARFILLKHRNRRVPALNWVTVRHEQGCGFYPYRPFAPAAQPVTEKSA